MTPFMRNYSRRGGLLLDDEGGLHGDLAIGSSMRSGIVWMPSEWSLDRGPPRLP